MCVCEDFGSLTNDCLCVTQNSRIFTNVATISPKSRTLPALHRGGHCGDIVMGTGEYYMRQEDGCPPAVLAGGSAPGESGVSVISLRFLQGLHFRGTPDAHLVWFQSPMHNVECRMADRILCHDAPAGSLAICPAGLDCAADAGQSVDTVIVSVDPAKARARRHGGLRTGRQIDGAPLRIRRAAPRHGAHPRR